MTLVSLKTAGKGRPSDVPKLRAPQTTRACVEITAAGARRMADMDIL
jgi:hypothetical protein